MIPPLNLSGVLPPFTGGDPRSPAQVAPYETSLEAVVDRYAISTERVAILLGLCAFRERLRSLQITNGYQWLCGSFTESIENLENRAPRDIDVVTFAYRPFQLSSSDSWMTFVHSNLDFFNTKKSKENYKCDAYYVDLNKPPHLIVADTTYWFGLFSHRRNGLWKGMLRVSLQSDDTAAKKKLQEAMP